MKQRYSLKCLFPSKFALLALLCLLCAPGLIMAAGTNAPTIVATAANSTINDNQNRRPFPGSAVIDDADNDQVTVTITVSPSNGGSFQSTNGLSNVGGTYTISQRSTSSATSFLQDRLVFVPTINQIPIGSSQTFTFTVYVTDSTGLFSSTNSNTFVTVNPVNDAPTIAGTAARSTTDKVTIAPFPNVTLSDVDNSGTQQVTVTVFQDDLAKGTILLNASGFNSSNGTNTFTGTPAAATTAIKALTYQPTQNRKPVGSTETTTFTIIVSDSELSDIDTSTIISTSVNDAPTLTGLTATHQPVATGRSITPFANAIISDPDPNDTSTNVLGQSLTLIVQLQGSNPGGQLQGDNITGNTYIASGISQTEATTRLRSLLYTAQSLPIVGTNSVGFTVTVTDTFNAGATNTTTVVDVYTPVSPPGLTGTRADQRVNDNSTITPFSNVSIQSFNAGAFSVILQLDSDSKGELVNLGGFSKSTSTTPNSYIFSGTSEAATAAIRQMLFQPTNNRINGSTNETTYVTVTLVDGGVTNVPDTTTSIIVTPVNDAPSIQGISALATIPDTSSSAPFPTVLITDVDELGNQQLTVTVHLDDNAKGTFNTNSLAVSGFVSNAGNYTFSGSPASATAAIKQLVFVPTPHRLPVGLTENTTFAITVDDGHGGIVANSSTIIRVAALNGGPVVSVPNVQPVSLPVAPPVKPLGLVSIEAPQNVTVTLQLTNATWGSFNATSLATNGFTNSAVGTYVFGGSASNATVALGNIEFLPNTNLAIGTAIYFTIGAQDTTGNSASANLAITFRQNQRSIIVTKTTDYDPNDSSVPDSQKYGTLRKAVADAGSNDHITFDLRSSDPGLPDYPTIIRLKRTLFLNKNVIFDGPGANLLTLSGDTDGDGIADVQLFQVNAQVTINRLSFTKGQHSFSGGAFEVNQGGSLKLSYCAVTDSSASVWGGGIDVNGGSIYLDHCLIKGNSTSASSGQGGGGISIYSDLPCVIANTTFSGNRQLSGGGLGGGAMYVEDLDPGVELDVFVVNSTFHENTDAAGHGTSIRPNVFNTVVQLQNTIVADGQGKNLEMDQSGAIISLGGNISDDATSSIFSAGGAPVATTILDQFSDFTNSIPSLLTLTNYGGPTLTYALGQTSVAIGSAVSNTPSAAFFDTLGTDQRGFIRDSSPDIGAFELNASKRIIIEEIQFAPAPPNTNDEFIEFYVPRDSTALNLAGYQVYVGGALRHTFASQNLNPGEALVLFSQNAVSTVVPGGVYKQIATNNLLLDNLAGTVTLKNTSNQTVLEISYVGSFTSSDPNDPGFLTATNQSLVLSPQFQGVYLPYQRVVQKEGGRIPNPGEFANPGYDASGNPLAIGNAPPRAFNDVASTDAATILQAVPVLANDFDPDSMDVIRVVGVGVTNAVDFGVTNVSAYSALGALLTINNSPQSGASISYDPTASAFIHSLPAGSNVVDTFQYTILDSSNGVDHVRGAIQSDINQNLVKATATVTVNITGVNFAPTPQDDDVNSSPVLTTQEDTVLDFTTANSIQSNDTDPNSDDNSSTLKIISVQSVPAYSNSLQTVSALGAFVTLDIRFNRNETHITYDPRGSAILNALGQGQTASDTFYYSVMDRYGAIGTAAIHVTVTGVNDVPTANPDSFATDEETPLILPWTALTSNDTDPDTGIINPMPTQLQITAVTPLSALGASVQIVGTNVIYDPTVSSNLNALARKEVVVDTFTCTVGDGYGGFSNAVVSVTVTGVNDAPIGTDDHYTANEKSLLVVSGPGVLSNDHDPDVNGVLPDDTLRVIPFLGKTTIGGAVVTMNPDGSFIYDPQGAFSWLKEGATTNDSFAYTVTDHSLTIANDDVFSLQGGSGGSLLPVLANDALLSQAGGSLSVVGLGAPSAGGTVAIAAQGKAVLYTPQLNFVGTDTFTYTISDGIGGTDTATVKVLISGSQLNANADAFVVAKGTSVNLDLLANDNILPVSGAAISITSVGGTDKGGLVSLNGTGPNNLIAYTPASTNVYPYVETFSYVITSGSLQTTGAVAVTVVDRNNTLAANDDNFVVVAGGGNNIFDVLANDQILPGGNTNLSIVSIQTNGLVGTISINSAHNRLVYKPAVGLTNHQEPFIFYTISDGAGGTATASVSIKVQPSGLFANDDVFAVMKGSANNTLSVIVNDAELPNLGQNLYISGIGIGTNAPNKGGAVAINGAGKGLLYTPATGFTGEELFTYEISDGTSTRALGHVRVKVMDTTTISSAPDAYTVGRDSANNTLAVLKNDYLLPRTPGSLTITGLKTNGLIGSVAISGGGSNNTLVYTPKAGFIGKETFGYEFVDGQGDKGTNILTVTVGGLIALNDSFSVLSGTATNILDVLANDLGFPDSTGVRPISGLGAPDHGGIVTTNSSATMVLYTPAPGFVGAEHFGYQSKDDSGAVVSGNVTVRVIRAGSDRDTRMVTITVIGVNDVPQIVGTGTNQITDKQVVQPFANVTISDLDEYGLQPLTVSVAMDNAVKGSLQSLGGFVNAGPGFYTYHGVGSNITTAIRGLVFVPTQNRITVPTTEAAVFTITVDDGYVVQPVVNASSVVNVTAADDAPTIAGTVAGQTVYQRSSIKPFAGVVIGDLDDFQLQPLKVTVTLDNAIKGNLTSLGGFVSLGGGVYTLGSTNAGVTAAAATTAMRGLIFNPTTAGRVTPSSPETTRFTIQVEDNFAAPVVDNTTTVIAMHPFTGRVVAGDHANPALFGASVGASRNVVVVGAPHDSLNGGTGSAYLFGRSQDGLNTWTQIKKLLPGGGTASDEFGYSAAIYGDIVVVGARYGDEKGLNAGSAYIFSRNQGGSNQWGQVKKLLASDGFAGAVFGSAVAVSGDTVVIGAPMTVGQSGIGFGAYIFSRNQGGSNQWGQVTKLLPSDGKPFDLFGTSVSIDGDTIVVGSPGSDGPLAGSSPDYGGAYVFARNQGGLGQWGQVKKLVGTDTIANDRFGSSVTVNLDTIVAGSPGADGAAGVDYGAAYIFGRNQGGNGQWGQARKLTAVDGFISDSFGSAVSLDGDRIIVGAALADHNGVDSGVAYLYGRNQGGSNQWGQLDGFLPVGVGAGDNFGSSVSLSQGTIAMGAPNGFDGATRFGTAFMFRVEFDNAPSLSTPIPNQFATVNVPYSFTLPSATFADADTGDGFSLSLGTGSPLPAWLAFDPATGTFSGTPDAPGTYVISVIATDSAGQARTGQMNLSVSTVVPNVFSLLSVTVQPNSFGQTATIVMAGNPGITYRLQRTAALQGNSTVWTDLNSAVADSNGIVVFYDVNAPAQSFYRATFP
ncbi:Ig-like domain-containing protein [Pedosphaera parvula]|nr:Ig-like domain-containing protein [Pedosphaera parvula]